MLHSIFRIVIVLSLAIQICRTTDRLEEPYNEEYYSEENYSEEYYSEENYSEEYYSEENYSEETYSDETDEDYGNPYNANDVTDPKMFKCNCLLKGLTHMRLARMSFSFNKIRQQIILGIVIGSNGREVLSILYKLDGVKIGSLWLFHLYTGLLRTYFISDINKARRRTDNVGKLIFEIHSYVTEIMVSDWNANNCPSYSLNDWYPQWFLQNREARLRQIKKTLMKNRQEFVSLVETKKELMNSNEKKMNEELVESLKIKPLFLNESNINNLIEISRKTLTLQELDWNDVGVMLKLSKDLAQQLTWPVDHLQKIKSYYATHFTFLKIIFFRITLKHLMYIKALDHGKWIYGQMYKREFARQWHTLLTNFGEMLHIEDDPHIRHLLKSFDWLLRKRTNTNNVIIGLEKILDLCGQSISCNANKPIILEEGTVENQLKNALKFSSSQEELTTQETAKNFMNDLKTVFTGVNFGVIRSLIEYIDELKLVINENE